MPKKKVQGQSRFVHWWNVYGCKCIPHSHSIDAQSVLEPADPSVHGGMPHSIYVLWLRWLSSRNALVKSLEGGGCGCWSLFSSKLCRIPYPKYMIDPSREMRRWEGKVGALLTYKCPRGLLSWCLTQFRGESVGRWLGFVTQRVSLSKEVTYQSPSRCQTGPRSKRSSASSSKHSQRCSPVQGQAKQEPVGKVSSSLNTPLMSERETHMGGKC